jgi:predicted MFS family arabinose efflux permease
MPERIVFKILPAVICVAFLLVPLIPAGNPLAGLALFALAGLGCSAMLPLIISFGQKSMPTIAASVAGLLIAFYQLGYGLAAFGVGPLENLAGLSLGRIFAFTAIPALILAALALRLSRRY